MTWIASVTQIKGTAANGDPGRSAAAERRSNKRFPSRRNLACQPVQRQRDANSWVGQAINLSEAGLCLELSRRFEQGALLLVDLQSEQCEPRSVIVRVVWIKSQPPGGWRMGCKFTQPLCESEIQEAT